MKIIKIEVSNHRNFRDGFVLDLSRPSFTKKRPVAGQGWGDCVFPVAAIYGANASGKTSVLRAVSYILAAITQSSGSWLDGSDMVRDPFRLGKTSVTDESRYAIDFVLEPKVNADDSQGSGVRYHFEFTVDGNGIKHELMQFYASQRPTTLWEREAANPKPKIVWGNAKIPTESMGDNFKFDVAPRELVLSRGLKLGSPLQSTLANALLHGLRVLNDTNHEIDLKLSILMEQLAAGLMSMEDFSDLARAADTGIEDVLLDQEEAEINPEISQLLERLVVLASGSANPSQESESAPPDAIDQQNQGKAMRRALRFRHRSADDSNPVVFSLGDESAGIIVWLSLIVPVVTTLKSGGVLFADELDADLHPSLTKLVVELFLNPESNPHGAQLIFTSHDVSLLLPQSEVDLNRHQIWITEKGNDGSSELFSLGDFTDIKSKTNVAKQYLEGRYGGVPILAPSLISRLVLDDSDGA